MTTEELFQLAYEAGFRGDNLRMAVAIALAESGGNPGAYNPELAAGTTPGAGSRGLWQIYGTAHPQYNSSIAFDPHTNARGAYEIFQQAGGKFTPWSTFNNGMAQSIYNSLKAPASLKNSANGQQTIKKTTSKGIQAGGASSSLGGGTSATESGVLAQQAQALKSISSGDWLSNAFSKIDKVNLSFFIGGILLFGVGLFLMIKEPLGKVIVEGTKIAAAAAV